MRKRSEIAAGILFALALAALFVLLTGSATAADRDIMGDWTISSGTTHLSDETIDVRGNVTVASGGILKLENCTLAINGSSDGRYRLTVESGGRLEVYGSLVNGSDGRIKVEFHDYVLFEGSTLQHIYGAQSSATRGIMLEDGSITFRDSTVTDSSYMMFHVKTDLTLDNVTVSHGARSYVYAYSYYIQGSATIRIEDCHFIGPGPGQWYMDGVYVYTSSQAGGAVDLVVKNTRIETFGRDLYLTGSTKLTAVVEGCELFDSDAGIEVYQTGGLITVKNNVIGHTSRAGAIGITVGVSSGASLVLENNAVEQTGIGYMFRPPATGGVITRSQGHLSVENCTVGIKVYSQYYGSVHLTIHNSSLRSITGKCFVATHDRPTDSVDITVYTTEHLKGSAEVSGRNAWVKAFVPVDITGARWKGGDQIPEGFLVLENRTHVEIARFNLSAIAPQDVPAWVVNNTGMHAFPNVIPAIYIEGHGFRGDMIDLWNYQAPSMIDIVDNFVPEITILEPSTQESFNKSTLLASGTYWELGSGMAFIEYSVDSHNLTKITSFHDGAWTLPLIDLPEGIHTLALRPTDAVGNVGEPVQTEFMTDTVKPQIDLITPPVLINTTTTMLVGMTEANSTLMVNGLVYPISPNGDIEVDIPLDEGSNTLTIVIVDLAGNSNTTLFEIVRDTIAPSLVLTAPENDTWTNARSVSVDGTTEPGANVRVQGIDVPAVDGTFHKVVTLTEGEITIMVSSTDRAGNRAMRIHYLHVDWTPPVLTIVEPESREVVTRESVLYLTGDVDDPSIDHVNINTQTVELTSGRFIKQYTLVEGRNEFNVTVTDAAGNFDSIFIVANKDLVTPSYNVTIEPIGGELKTISGKVYSTSLSVEAHVTLSELAYISLPDGTDLQPTTEARVRFDLEEGSNELQLQIRDLAGNQANAYIVTIHIDTTSPSITIIEPEPGLRTKEESVIVHGRTEEGSQVMLDGSHVEMLPGGEFRVRIVLEEKRNDINIEVVDPMGNNNSFMISVYKEPEVTTGEEADTSTALAGGFMMGLIVGVVVTVLLMMSWARRQRVAPVSEAVAKPERMPAKGAAEKPEEEEAPKPPRRGGDWEEF
jgi:hypothetical protein